MTSMYPALWHPPGAGAELPSCQLGLPSTPRRCCSQGAASVPYQCRLAGHVGVLISRAVLCCAARGPHVLLQTRITHCLPHPAPALGGQSLLGTPGGTNQGHAGEAACWGAQVLLEEARCKSCLPGAGTSMHRNCD